MLTSLVLLAFSSFFCGTAAGPAVIASKGEVWPKPQQEEKTDSFYIVRPQEFSFKGPENIGCPNLLNEIFARYKTIITTSSAELQPQKFELNDGNNLGYLDTLAVELTGECNNEEIRPKLEDNETYNLEINVEGATLESPTIWGILRGLETFSQLIYSEKDYLVVNATSITDFPRFPHRGLMLDTSRHFLPVDTILANLDAMSYNKMNVFHWHLTDESSFPYKSFVYPELSEKGAYHPISKVYTQSDIAKVIEYARVRGIRVIPEFDSPGHTASWGSSHPELLTTCYSSEAPNGELGPLDPIKQETYYFLATLFTEVAGVFYDSYFHMGGDEVDTSCWESNPDIRNFINDNNLTSYAELNNYFTNNVVDILGTLGKKHIVWEEVFLNEADLPNDAVVHVWRWWFGTYVLERVVQAGKYAIYSTCWYLDQLANGGDWEKLYKCDPHNFSGSDEEKKLVLGGEACMWTEYVNEYNVMPRVWPRASAAAEKLWASMGVNDTSAAKPRLEEHTCRMNRRGIPAQPPNGPGVCL